jgi:hypothetical protein
MKLYVVFQHTQSMYDWREKEYVAMVTEFQGVFDTFEKALENCLNENYWFGACELNESFPEESVEWNEAYDHNGDRIE